LISGEVGFKLGKLYIYVHVTQTRPLKIWKQGVQLQFV